MVLIFPLDNGIELVFFGEKTHRCRASLLRRCCVELPLKLLLGEVTWAAVEAEIAGIRVFPRKGGDGLLLLHVRYFRVKCCKFGDWVIASVERTRLMWVGCFEFDSPWLYVVYGHQFGIAVRREHGGVVMGDSGRFGCIFVHLRDPQLQDFCWQEVTRRKHSHTQVVVCVSTLGARC